MKRLRPFLVVTDVGFVAYWAFTALGLIPAEYAFRNYDDPVLVAWNWSFLPLDLLVSVTGFASLYLYRRGSPSWERVALLSLALTFCAGLQALAFWTIRLDFSLAWWLPNLFLMLYPLFFLPRLIASK